MVLINLMFVLCGFILSMLGVITFIHSEHMVIALLLLFGGVMITFQGLPRNEDHGKL